jgi:hypothetical protein
VHHCALESRHKREREAATAEQPCGEYAVDFVSIDGVVWGVAIAEELLSAFRGEPGKGEREA